MSNVVQLHARRPNALRHLSDQALSNALLEAMAEREIVERKIRMFDAELERRKQHSKDA